MECIGGGGDHLADDAAGIDHDLADAHAVAAAGIEHEALARGIQVDVEDRGELHVQAAALHDAEHAAQAIVVGRRRLQARHARAVDEHLVAQAAVFRR